MRHAIAKVTESGNLQVFVTERGFSFGYHNLVVDMRAFPMLRSLGYPVVYDATHSLQLPGGGDGVTAGQAEYIEPLAAAAVAAGVDGLFVEVHDDPPHAKSDGQNALLLDRLEPLLRRLLRIDTAARGGSDPMTKSVMGSDPLDRSLARRVLQTEAAAITALVDRLDEHFDHAVHLLYGCQGRVILTGMGKSGIICRKIAATLASTGTAAFFLHPAEATHGDLGVIQPSDVLLAISYSGETQEILKLLEAIRRIGARIIAMTGNPASTLAQAADVALDCHVSKEACPLNLVPTASTTATLAMGDALCMTLLVEKGFREEDFARFIRGKLGKKLMRVDQLMHTGGTRPWSDRYADARCDLRDVRQSLA
jgi:D-arabinose 5-phosphate isomerase GutQ